MNYDITQHLVKKLLEIKLNVGGRWKISFVSIEDGITALGFRKMASFAKSTHPSTDGLLFTIDQCI